MIARHGPRAPTVAWTTAGAAAVAAAAAVALALPEPAAAQMFHLYLGCKGTIVAGGKTRPATLDLALRDNNQTALVQRSNVLPVGERMRYTPSSTHYALVYTTPLRGSAVHAGWSRTIVAWWPGFDRVVTTRLSVDRQTGALEGEMVDAGDAILGRLKLACQPMRQEDAPAPRF